MNQILSTSMPFDDRKKNKNRKLDIGNVLKFLGISLMTFGVLMCGTGAYSFYIEQVEQKDANLEPTISIVDKTDNTILVNVMHKKNISKLEYRWNDGETVVVNGNNGKYLEKQISIPSGNNVLHILVQDETGKEITYEKQYETESNINLEVAGNKIKINYEADNNVSYMTYRWDENEENKVDIDSNTIEYEMEVLKGLHTLTIVVVDEYNHTDTKIQKINGVSKPELTIELDSEFKHFVIKASDEEKITKIEYRLDYDDSKQYELNLEDMDTKELEYTVEYEFEQGENIIEVTVYNINGVTNQHGAKYIKQ